MEHLIAFLIGGILTLVFIKSKKFLDQIKRANLKELENKQLRQENEELKTKIVQNANDINDLKIIIPGIEDQVLTILELISSLTTIKKREDILAIYASTLEFRKAWGIHDEKSVSENYISED